MSQNSDTKYIQAECTSVDFETQTVACRGNGSTSCPAMEVSFDQLVIAVGAEPNTFNIPGVKEHSLFMKEIDDGKFYSILFAAYLFSE